MRRDRDAGVTHIPVLIPAITTGAADGVTFLQATGFTNVHLLAVDWREAALSDSVRVQFASKYKKLSEPQWNELISLIALIRAVETGLPRDFEIYASRRVIVEYEARLQTMRRDAKVLGAKWANPDEGTRQQLIKKIREDVSGRTATLARELLVRLNKLLESPRIVAWWTLPAKQFSIGIYCTNVEEAFAAALLSQINSHNSVSVCQNPKCNRLFVRTKLENLYHDTKCGNAHRKARQRAKDLRSSAKRKKSKD